MARPIKSSPFSARGKGRLTGIAKGAHRSKKRFVNGLELFSMVLLNYSQRTRDRLAIVNEVELLNSFINVRHDYGAYQAASAIREIVLGATGEQMVEDDFFQLTLWGFHALDSGKDTLTVLALFVIKMFACIGYRPVLENCQGCGMPYRSNGAAMFSPAAGRADLFTMQIIAPWLAAQRCRHRRGDIGAATTTATADEGFTDHRCIPATAELLLPVCQISSAKRHCLLESADLIKDGVVKTSLYVVVGSF
jgi:hypothetical protein